MQNRPSTNDPLAMINSLVSSLRETAEEVTPWFKEQMPPVYFQDTPEKEQLEHLRAIIAARASGQPIELTLKNAESTKWTIMRPKDGPGVLAKMVSRLPMNKRLRSAKIHTSKDGTLCIDVFEFGDSPLFEENDLNQRNKLKETIDWANSESKNWEDNEIKDFFKCCAGEMISGLTPIRLHRHYSLFKILIGKDSAIVHLEEESDPNVSRIIVAAGNTTRRLMLERITQLLADKGINVHRAHLDSIKHTSGNNVAIMSFIVQDAQQQPIVESSNEWRLLREDLLRLKWLDRRALDFAYASKGVSLLEAEIVTALADVSFQNLVKVNPYRYSTTRVNSHVEENAFIAAKIAGLLVQRFDPEMPLDDDTYYQRRLEIKNEIEMKVDLEDGRTVLDCLVKAVDSIFRTNLHIPTRYGLAFRFNPSFFQHSERPDEPYGIFSVHGRGFQGFHVRFRNIARGGIRAIHPYRSIDQHVREKERLYEEAYNLAFAQQLKNKDIPEGGAKAAILVHPTGDIDESVKGFVDGILDLITPAKETKRYIVDKYGEEELLYLGPDENITPELIMWIANRSKERGYPMARALMSSKPGAGINHKEYGVTSEGVAVYLARALSSRGFNLEKDTFTIKLTGGPDGDVAGNMIRILHRDYGERAKIVGIADGSGSAEDPAGLQHKELIRLFNQSRPIADFDKSVLGPAGRVTTIDEPNGFVLRNSLHNRMRSDAFVPCGGRPATIHANNWKEYLTPNNEPSSPIIIEGANLFLTPKARKKLSEHGVLIFKDSSANKCGVICSSFEIIASMLLDEKTFLEIKDVFVKEVISILRSLAESEATLLARLGRDRKNIPLPDLSIELSQVMMRTADAIYEALPTLSDEEKNQLDRLAKEHIPPILLEKAGDKLTSSLPKSYLDWMVVKSLAAKIIYREGIGYLSAMPKESIAPFALEYLGLEKERLILEKVINSNSIEHKNRLVEIIKKSGIISTMLP